MKRLKKLLCSVLTVSLLSLFAIPVGAFNSVSPSVLPFLVKQGDGYTFKSDIPLNNQNDTVKEIWNEFVAAFTGASDSIPIITYFGGSRFGFYTASFLVVPQPARFSYSDKYLKIDTPYRHVTIHFNLSGSCTNIRSFENPSGGSPMVIDNASDHKTGILWAPGLKDFPSNFNVADIESLTIPGGFSSASHTLTINYQYEDGSKAQESYIGTFSTGQTFEVITPSLTGFTPSASVISGRMGDADLTYTVTYAPGKYNLTINYQYEDGSQASQPYAGTFAEGESFNITTPVLSGFKPSINIVSGQMGNTDLSYTVTYTPIKHNLTINYQYENGSQALEPYSGTFAEGESFSITVPVIGGYKPSVNVISGKMENKDLTYTVTYTPVTHTVSVKYQFEDGSQAAEPYTGSFAEGQPYSIPTPIIEGFTPSLSIISGEMGTGDLSYTVIFTKDKEPEPPPSSSEDSSSGGESSGGGSSSGESSGGGSSGGSSSGGGSGEGSSGGRGYVVWNPALVAQGFKNVSNQAGIAFNTGIWVFLGITGIVLMIKLLRDLFK